MKIVYVVPLWGSSMEEGIIRKVLYQKKALEGLGCEVNLITFYDSYNVYGCTINDSGIKKINRYYTAYKKLIDAVQYKKPDYIYVRDVMWYFNLYSKLSRLAPTFIEIQTDVLSESKLINKKRYIIENLYKRSYIRNVSGKVCITGEIAEIESRYNSKPFIILGNGIDRDEIVFIPKKDTNNLINLFFIGSPGMPWQGIDRLISSYKKAPNREKFKLHIVGYADIYKMNDKNLIFYGFIKDNNEINKIISEADIGIGGLSLYYKKMNQAAPLKIRNYLSKGLPVVISHEDTDINEDLPFVLRVLNDNSTIDFIKLEEFYYKVREIRRNGETVKYSIENLTWDKKMKKLLGFMENTVKKLEINTSF